MTTFSATIDAAIARVRADVARLHGELVRNDLTPENMVLCDLEGVVVGGSPGSDHTHSTFAVAWAARGEEIPCVITAMADEFGGPIPIGPFAIIGDDSIGCGIVQTLRGHRSRAVLMQNHGPFTIGTSPAEAVKAAVMVEDGARTVHHARAGGPMIPIPQPAIDALYDRYQNVYGQSGDDRR